MSPALKSKMKNKSSTSAAKEQQKIPSKPFCTAGNGVNVPASAYNPVSGTFPALEMIPTASSASQNNGRFQHIDETETHSGSSPGTAAEYDSLSNNESCSGESEDQKDKLTTASLSTSRPEAIPGCDNDKRDKIRQKNEKKHQRQKERRAQELHERCTGFLMSRKLDFLTEKIVGMGFAVEQATRALMLNDGRAEDSVLWLLEGGVDEELDSTKSDGRANLKIDICDELAKIAELEIKFKCSKQDVERAVVFCEGDLKKAAEILKAQKHELEVTLPKTVKSGETIPINGTAKVISATQNPISRLAGKPSASVTIQQPKRDERDPYLKMATSVSTLPDPRSRTLQSSIKMQSKIDWSKNVAVQNERRLPSMGPTPSVSYSQVSPLQAATPAKVDAHYAMAGNKGRANFQPGTLKEPVIVMQRPQSVNVSHNLPSTSVGISGLPQLTAGWNSNAIPSVNMIKAAEGVGRQNFHTINNLLSSSQPFYQTNQAQQIVSSLDVIGWGGSSWSNGRYSTGFSSLTTPSSLGLFTGWSSVGSPRSSTVDWSMIGSSMPEFDYTSIDWSMDLSSSMPDSPSSLRANRSFESWSTTFMGVRPATPNLTPNGVHLDLVEGASIIPMDPSPYIGSQQWTSPFAGKDIFRVPRQFVSSPSL